MADDIELQKKIRALEERISSETRLRIDLAEDKLPELERRLNELRAELHRQPGYPSNEGPVGDEYDLTKQIREVEAQREELVTGLADQLQHEDVGASTRLAVEVNRRDSQSPEARGSVKPALKAALKEIIKNPIRDFKAGTPNEVTVYLDRKNMRALVIDTVGFVKGEIKLTSLNKTALVDAGRRLAKLGIEAVSDPSKAGKILQGIGLAQYVTGGFNTIRKMKNPAQSLQMMKEFADILMRNKKGASVAGEVARWYSKWHTELSGTFGELWGYGVYLQGMTFENYVDELLQDLDDDDRRALNQTLRNALKGASAAIKPRIAALDTGKVSSEYLALYNGVEDSLLSSLRDEAAHLDGRFRELLGVYTKINNEVTQASSSGTISPELQARVDDAWQKQYAALNELNAANTELDRALASERISEQT